MPVIVCQNLSYLFGWYCHVPIPHLLYSRQLVNPYYSQNYLVKGTWKGHARVHSVLEKQLLRSPESVHIKVRENNYVSFPSGHRKVSIMTGCPNQVGVYRAVRFHESNLFCLFQFVKLSLDMDQNHAMRYYEICIVEIKRTKNILRNIFH